MNDLLPTDVVMYIYKFFYPNEIYNLSLVSKYHYENIKPIIYKYFSKHPIAIIIQKNLAYEWLFNYYLNLDKSECYKREIWNSFLKKKCEYWKEFILDEMDLMKDLMLVDPEFIDDEEKHMNYMLKWFPYYKRKPNEEYQSLNFIQLLEED
jgi:hypothetical protein